MAIIRAAQVCVAWFLIGASICYAYCISPKIPIAQSIVEISPAVFLGTFAAVTYSALYLCVSSPSWLFSVSIRALSLGHGFGLGLILAFSGSSFSLFGWYITALSFFHVTEFLATAITNPSEVNIESFLLDHSTEYHIAMVASMVEFCVEWFVFPGYKQPCWLAYIGLCVVIGGEVLRKGAMFTAMRNFNHYVQQRKRRDHELVTTGIYSLFRHPSYVGWFYWSIGTQLMVLNPFCLVLYAVASWQFFQDRVEYEEMTLVTFFGDQYLQYQKSVPTGLPFIKGYVQYEN